MKKNILILNYEYPPLGGGGGVASEKLANGWVKAGYNVDVITSDFRKLPKREKRNGVNIYRVKTFGRKDQFSAHFFCLLTYLFFGFLMSIHLCRSKSYAFINTHFVLPTGPLGFSIQKIFRIKNVLSLHGGDVYDPSKKTSPHKHIIFRIIIRFLLNQSDFVVAQSSNTKKNTIRYYTPTREIHVIPLAYEPILFPQKTRSDLGLKQEKQYLISTGRLVERKGYTYLIRALSMLDDHIELILIGDGPQKKSLLSLVRNLGLKKRIHFMGYVSEEVKMQLLDVADIYVLSSLHEGFGIVLQEAMQVGLPIVATNNGGQTDFLIEKKNALLISPKNPHEIAQKVKELFLDTLLMKNIKIRNKKDISKYSAKNICHQYLQLIKT